MVAQREGENKSMTKTAVKKEKAKTREAGVFTKRIGYINYRVGIHFSGTNTETVQDKILRLVKNEAAAGWAVNQ